MDNSAGMRTLLQNLRCHRAIDRRVAERNSFTIPFEIERAELGILAAGEIQSDIVSYPARRCKQNRLVGHSTAADVQHRPAKIGQFFDQSIKNGPTGEL